MNDMTFALKHDPSESLFFISFVRRNGKVKIQEKSFAKGNVVSLTAVRAAKIAAGIMLF